MCDIEYVFLLSFFVRVCYLGMGSSSESVAGSWRCVKRMYSYLCNIEYVVCTFFLSLSLVAVMGNVYVYFC